MYVCVVVFPYRLDFSNILSAKGMHSTNPDVDCEKLITLLQAWQNFSFVLCLRPLRYLKMAAKNINITFKVIVWRKKRKEWSSAIKVVGVLLKLTHTHPEVGLNAAVIKF